MRTAPRVLLPALLLLVLWLPISAQQQYAVKGMVISIDRAAKSFTASIDAIPGYMQAMAMPFVVPQGDDLDGLVPGAIVEFVLVVDGRSAHAEQIRIVRYESVEQDPFNASRLAVLREIVSGPLAPPVKVGEIVPDFTLLDQRSRPLKLSSLRGRVVAVNFIYTNCALPNFCLRIANNFAVLQRRFKARLGRDLELLTITFDPTHDTPAALADYARQWNADPATWRFLTGDPTDVQRVCQMFGVQAFPNEGLLDHNLHTALIDRSGRLIANIEGNQFTVTQLTDLVASLLEN